MQFEICDSFDSVLPLKEQWNNLVAESSFPNIFNARSPLLKNSTSGNFSNTLFNTPFNIRKPESRTKVATLELKLIRWEQIIAGMPS